MASPKLALALSLPPLKIVGDPAIDDPVADLHMVFDGVSWIAH
jgi:hypothetical protein